VVSPPQQGLTGLIVLTATVCASSASLPVTPPELRHHSARWGYVEG
jgi:hypothetical protein